MAEQWSTRMGFEEMARDNDKAALKRAVVNNMPGAQDLSSAVGIKDRKRNTAIENAPEGINTHLRAIEDRRNPEGGLPKRKPK
eukprot:14456684-Alexandrium_andersonii.AAC.1